MGRFIAGICEYACSSLGRCSRDCPSTGELGRYPLACPCPTAPGAHVHSFSNARPPAPSAGRQPNFKIK
eukprot:603908-Pyramimonas_sp.AAC.1